MEEQRTIVAKRNRGRVVYVPISFVERILGGRMKSSEGDRQYVYLPVIEGIPEDAELVFIMAAPERDAIMLKYIHESFDEVPEGNMFPAVEMGMMTFKKVEVEKEPNNGG